MVVYRKCLQMRFPALRETCPLYRTLMFFFDLARALQHRSKRMLASRAVLIKKSFGGSAALLRLHIILIILAVARALI